MIENEHEEELERDDEFSHDEAPSHYDDFTDNKIEFAPSLDRSKILENVRRFISLNQD